MSIGFRPDINRHNILFSIVLLAIVFSLNVNAKDEIQFLVLEDFEQSVLAGLPDGWVWKQKDNDKYKPYEIRVENDYRYLAAQDHGESVILGKKIKWDLQKYPFISFRWRVHQLPAGGDQRFSNTADSAAAIYIIYYKVLGLLPRTIKYVWSSTQPVGAAFLREGIGRPWVVVAESSEDNLGEWRTYVFNARSAYRETFGKEPPRYAIGLALLSDANATKSRAVADYDDIRALSHADSNSGIRQILKIK